MSREPRDESLRVASSGAEGSGSLPDFAAAERSEPALAVGARGRLKTQLLDLSALRAPALEGQATVNVGEAPSPFQIASGSTLMWSIGALRRAPSEPARGVEPDAAAKAAPAPALDRTLCDRGALRDYARQLAAALPSSAPAAGKPEPVGRWAKLRRATLARPFPRRMLAVTFRQRLLALSVLAGLGTLPWLLGAPSAAQGSRATAEPPSSAAAPPPEAMPTEVVPAEDLAPPRGEAREDTLAPDAGAAPSRRALRPTSKRLEHEAFRAAFGGDVTEAVALYEELARSRAEPVFQHAARLLRQNRVHKP